MTQVKQSQRKQESRTWGTRAMRNPHAGARRYDPGTEALRTGTARQEGEAQSPSFIDHGGLGGLGDDDHTQYLQKAGGTFTGMPRSSQTVDAGTSIILGSKMTYVFTGTTDTWTLPALAGNTGVRYWIKNRGSGNLTIARAGSDELYDTAARTSITIAAGQGCYIENDGSYWLVLIKG